MQEILLEITGTQRMDSMKDTTQLTTVGTLEHLDDCYIIRYTERQEPPEQPVHVTVKIAKDARSVEMTRAGVAGAHLVIETANRNLCRYGTQYGDILLGIAGHSIESDVCAHKGSFTFCYDIDINGALASRNEVKLAFKKNQE